MQLTDVQKQTARQWIADGMKLSDFQRRLETEFGIKLTYMEVRFLVDDLKVLPKDPEPPKTPEPAPAPAAASSAPSPGLAAPGEPAEPAGLGGGVSVSVDAVTQPGTMVSGKVTFGDGQKATWYVDQYGRPGLVPDQKGYRPSREDLQEFQVALDRELTRLGM